MHIRPLSQNLWLRHGSSSLTAPTSREVKLSTEPENPAPPGPENGANADLLGLFERWVDPATYIVQTRLSLASAAPQPNLRSGLEAGLELSGRLLTGAAGVTLKLFCLDGRVAAVLGGDKPQRLYTTYSEEDEVLLIDLPDETQLHLSNSVDQGIFCSRFGDGSSTSVVFQRDGVEYAVDGFRLASHRPDFDAILGARNLLHDRPESWIATASPEGTRTLKMTQDQPPTFAFERDPSSGPTENGHQAQLSHLDGAARTVWEDLGMILKR